MSENCNQGGYVQLQSNGMAVASLVLGILSILFVWIPFIGLVSWILAPIGLVLGLVALKQPFGRGMAIAGSICSGIGLLGCIGWLVLIGAAVAVGSSAVATDCMVEAAAHC